MIERQIDRPIPIPSGLVVKKALKRRSAFSGSMPMPESFTSSSGSRHQHHNDVEHGDSNIERRHRVGQENRDSEGGRYDWEKR